MNRNSKRIIIAVIVLLVAATLACNDTGGEVVTNTPAAGAGAGDCHTRVFAECREISGADVCEEFAHYTCEQEVE